MWGQFLKQFHAFIDPIAVLILKWMNAIAGTVMLGISAFSALHPNFPAEIQKALGLSNFMTLILGFVWCMLVQYVLRRAAKQNLSAQPMGPPIPFQAAAPAKPVPPPAPLVPPDPVHPNNPNPVPDDI